MIMYVFNIYLKMYQLLCNYTQVKNSLFKLRKIDGGNRFLSPTVSHHPVVTPTRSDTCLFDLPTTIDVQSVLTYLKIPFSAPLRYIYDQKVYDAF